MRAFISSTYEDLSEHRTILEQSLSISGIDFNAMEHFGSVSTPPLQTCLDAIDQSDCFIGVLGVKYGASPPKSKLSFTEREYQHARSLKIPMLMFLIDPNRAAVSPESLLNETADQQARLKKLKTSVEKKHTVTYFTTPEDLARLVLASLIKQIGVIP